MPSDSSTANECLSAVRGRSRRLTAAGIMLIVSGILSLLLSLLLLALFVMIGIVWHSDIGPDDYGEIYASLFLRVAGLGAIICFLLGMLSVIGGICALRRKRWGLALAAAICITIVLLSSSILLSLVGIVIIVFVVQSKDEFQPKTPAPDTVSPHDSGAL